MALEDDLAMDSDAPPKSKAAKSSLDADLGGGTDWSDSDGSVESKDPGKTPVSDEAIKVALNTLRQAPRHVIQALGSLASTFGNNQPNDLGVGLGGTGMKESGAGALYQGSKMAADALEENVPALKPVNEGPIERILGQGLETGLQGIGGGPEAVIPAISSGIVSQGIKEGGGGPLAQTAGALSPFAPAAGAAALRGVVRQGSVGAEAMQGSINAARDAGLPTSVGAASGNPIIKAYEGVASKLPGGKPLADVRNVNKNAEASVSDIIKKVKPDYDVNPPTPSEAGSEIKEGARNTIQKGKEEVKQAKDELYEAVGGGDHPMAAPRTQRAAENLNPTGNDAIDNVIVSARAKKIGGTINKVTDKPQVETGYHTDGEGAHAATSPNGETHAVETATGDIKVTRSDTHPDAQGQGEGTARLETLAHAATGKGKSLVSDMSVSPQEAKAYEALGRRGWNVEKNPNAEVNPATGNTISDSPKNPVYKVTAPKTGDASLTTKTPGEKQFTGEWTYDPKTGRSEPVTQNKTPELATEGGKAELNPDTPWTFDNLRQLRTNVGQQIRNMPNSPQKQQLQRFYGEMSEDLNDFVKSKGSDAEQKWEFFNSTAKLRGDQRVALEKAIKESGGTGEVFTKAMRGSAVDAGNIARVMGAMDEDGKNTFRAVVLHRMGRKAGAQTEPFSADTFLTNWNKMSMEGKNALFGEGKSSDIRKSLDNLSKALTDSKLAGNLKSNLGQTIHSNVPHGVGPAASIIGGALAIKEFAHPVVRMAAEHPVAASLAGVGTAGVVGINPIMSRVLTNPKVINWFAQTTRLNKAAIPGAIAQLRSMGSKDPDAKALADWLDDKGGGGANSTSQTKSTPAPGGPGADGTDFVNPGKMGTIRVNGRNIQGIDPNDFGSRFNNPKVNPKALPPDLPPQASDFQPAT